MVPGVKREVLYGHVSQVLVDLVVRAVHAAVKGPDYTPLLPRECGDERERN